MEIFYKLKLLGQFVYYQGYQYYVSLCSRPNSDANCGYNLNEFKYLYSENDCNS